MAAEEPRLSPHETQERATKQETEKKGSHKYYNGPKKGLNQNKKQQENGHQTMKDFIMK